MSDTTQPTTTSPTAIVIAQTELVPQSSIAQALAHRDGLLARSRKGTVIRSAESAARAVALQRELSEYEKGIEALRKQAKAPLLERTAAIDALGKELTAEVAAEKQRIAGLVGAWNAEQERLAEEERKRKIALQRDRANELRAFAATGVNVYQLPLGDMPADKWEELLTRSKQEHEQRETERREREAKAEQERKAEAERIAAAKAQNDAVAAAQAEADAKLAEQKRLEDAEALRLKQAADAKLAAQATRETVAAVAPAGPSRVVGTGTRTEVEYEITDVKAAYAHRPEWFELKPRDSVIKSALRAMEAGTEVPGVKFTKIAKAILR